MVELTSAVAADTLLSSSVPAATVAAMAEDTAADMVAAMVADMATL